MAEVLLFPERTSSTEPTRDAAARMEALDIQSSFIVEAPAGSGKTGLLIQRYLKLLADDSVTSPEQVLAITFTNKAATELRDRVLHQLELAESHPTAPSVNEFDRQTRALAAAVLLRDRQLGWSLLQQPHRLHLRTIDSVCSEIARSLPILSGSGGRLTPATDAAPLYHEAARRTLLLLGSGNSTFDEAVRDLLLHRDGNLTECESLIADMLRLRDQWARLVPHAQLQFDDTVLDITVRPKLEHALDLIICRTLSQLEQAFPPDLLAELTELASRMAHANGYKGQLSPIAFCKGKLQSPESIAKDLKHWRALARLLLTQSGSISWRKLLSKNLLGFEIEKHHSKQLKDLIQRISITPRLLEALCAVDELPPAEYPEEQWAVAKSLFRVLSRALVELQLVFAERGECDFTELSLLAQHALAQNSSMEDLAAALGARIQHLLVDEMQDTSTSQYNLIESLTESWDGHSQTVFLVGDPHQSIYLFRQARVERFVQAMQTRRLGDLPLKRLRLTANFRSQQALVEQFNHDFGLIFPQSAESVAYNPVRPTLPASSTSTGTTWHAHVVSSRTARDTSALTDAELQQRQAQQDAEEIVRIARGWLAKPLPAGRTRPWSIAVLVRGRNHLEEIVSALRQQSEAVPFRAVEIEALNQRQEILDLTALTRALLHPADRVAWLAILRAPWCGLTLADLYTLTDGDDPDRRHLSILRLLEERGHLLSDESCLRMGRVWNVLQAANKKRAGLGIAQLVERAWLSLGGDAWLTSAQMANARRFFQLLDELGARGDGIEPGILNARLGSLYAEPQPIPAGTGYIELLTIHKAKGLEWDVVFVPALGKTVAANRARLLTWLEIETPSSSSDDVAPVMLAPIAGKGEDSQVLNKWLNGIHRKRELAEDKRLFYVACTRAHEELHLFGTVQRNKNGDINPKAGSLLYAAWPAAEAHYQVQPASPGAIESTNSETANDDAASPVQTFDLAAGADPTGIILERLPVGFDPSARFSNGIGKTLDAEPGASPASLGIQFSRPEGSVAARAFGNAVHAFLDELTNRIVGGATPASLRTELPRWTTRAAALLRSYGLARSVVERLARDTRNTLEAVLNDSAGLWLLDRHSRACSELSVTSVLHAGSESIAAGSQPATVRVDRIFETGAEPSVPGDDFLWIIDYKTTAPGPSQREAFLTAQRATYGPQLEAYARVLGPARGKSPANIRLALYFPTVPHLLWWPYEPGRLTSTV